MTTITTYQKNPLMIQDHSAFSSIRNNVEWISRKVYKVNYTILDAANRTISNLDGIDKVNKLMRAIISILVTYFKESQNLTILALNGVDSSLKISANFISSFIAVGRTKAVIAVDSKGELELKRESSLKKPSLVFLALGKDIELISWLKSVDLFPTFSAGSIDIQYFSNISEQIGLNPIFETVASIGMVRAKNYAIIISSGLSLLDNIEKIREGKDFTYCALGVANDMGKIVMCSIPMLFISMVETYSFKFMAAAVATLAISKILYKSYKDNPINFPKIA